MSFHAQWKEGSAGDAQQQQQQQQQQQAAIECDAQEDLAVILFILMFHQVSSVSYYHELSGPHSASATTTATATSKPSSNDSTSSLFNLDANILERVQMPFSSSGSHAHANESYYLSSVLLSSQQQPQPQQQTATCPAFELNERLQALLNAKLSEEKLDKSSSCMHSFDHDTSSSSCNATNTTMTSTTAAAAATRAVETSSIRQVLERKLRINWNINWHGGSLVKLCDDLLYNEQLISTQQHAK